MITIITDAGKRAASSTKSCISCIVWRVGSNNAVCMQAHPDCKLATPYGNYCEHPLVYQLPPFQAPCLAALSETDAESLVDAGVTA